MVSQSECVAPARELNRDGSASSTSEPRLWVELDVEIGADHRCPLAGLPATDGFGTVQLVGSTCHLTIETGDEKDDGSRVRTVATPIDDGCICAAVCGPGFAPVQMTVEHGRLTIGAYATDRERLSDATERLEDLAEQWRLQRLATPSTNSTSATGWRSGHLDDLSLTEKQREAVQTAVDRGYYRRPRDSSLGDLAEELGVTRSALSQRLNAVEMKLVTALTRQL